MKVQIYLFKFNSVEIKKYNHRFIDYLDINPFTHCAVLKEYINKGYCILSIVLCIGGLLKEVCHSSPSFLSIIAALQSLQQERPAILI